MDRARQTISGVKSEWPSITFGPCYWCWILDLIRLANQWIPCPNQADSTSKTHSSSSYACSHQSLHFPLWNPSISHSSGSPSLLFHYLHSVQKKVISIFIPLSHLFFILFHLFSFIHCFKFIDVDHLNELITVDYKLYN